MKITDAFVENLNAPYESFGLFNSMDYVKHTSKGTYQVMPTGRLINVKIDKYVEDKEYYKLLKKLERHYRGNANVNKVYRCQAGTLMIDCRN